MGWGGDVNVRLKLNTPLLLRWSWGGVEMWTFGWSWTRLCCYADHGVGWGGVARQKRSEICAVRVAKSKKNDLFWEHVFPDQKATKHWKGCHFFQHVDAPTRAIPHPAGCLCYVMFCCVMLMLMLCSCYVNVVLWYVNVDVMLFWCSCYVMYVVSCHVNVMLMFCWC